MAMSLIFTLIAPRYLILDLYERVASEIKKWHFGYSSDLKATNLYYPIFRGSGSGPLSIKENNQTILK